MKTVKRIIVYCDHPGPSNLSKVSLSIDYFSFLRRGREKKGHLP